MSLVLLNLFSIKKAIVRFRISQSQLPRRQPHPLNPPNLLLHDLILQHLRRQSRPLQDTSSISLNTRNHAIPQDRNEGFNRDPLRPFRHRRDPRGAIRWHQRKDQQGGNVGLAPQDTRAERLEILVGVEVWVAAATVHPVPRGCRSRHIRDGD